MTNQEALSEDLESDSFLNKLCPPEVRAQTLLQIRLISCTSKRWNNHKQALFVRNNAAGTKNVRENKDAGS